MSNSKVVYPIFLLPVRNTFVAPILPEPIFRMSFFKKNLVKRKPKGIDPIRYESVDIIKISIFII